MKVQAKLLRHKQIIRGTPESILEKMILSLMNLLLRKYMKKQNQLLDLQVGV